MLKINLVKEVVKYLSERPRKVAKLFEILSPVIITLKVTEEHVSEEMF